MENGILISEWKKNPKLRYFKLYNLNYFYEKYICSNNVFKHLHILLTCTQQFAILISHFLINIFKIILFFQRAESHRHFIEVRKYQRIFWFANSLQSGMLTGEWKGCEWQFWNLFKPQKKVWGKRFANCLVRKLVQTLTGIEFNVCSARNWPVNSWQSECIQPFANNVNATNNAVVDSQCLWYSHIVCKYLRSFKLHYYLPNALFPFQEEKVFYEHSAVNTRVYVWKNLLSVRGCLSWNFTDLCKFLKVDNRR